MSLYVYRRTPQDRQQPTEIFSKNDAPISFLNVPESQDGHQCGDKYESIPEQWCPLCSK